MMNDYNEVLKQLYERKSVRAYTEQDISPEEKEKILLAASMAPTAGNQQLYTILDITDQRKKEQLAETCDHQPFIAKAKMVLIFCADCQKWYDAFVAADCAPRKPAVGDLMLAVSDAVIAAQNSVVAAYSLGIGSCYIGDIMENCEIHRNMLNLPEYVFPAAMVVFGYPTQQQSERTKPGRAELSYLVHENGYHEITAEETRETLIRQNKIKEYDSWMEAFCNRKYNSEFSREMSRSVARYLEAYDSGK